MLSLRPAVLLLLLLTLPFQAAVGAMALARAAFVDDGRGAVAVPHEHVAAAAVEHHHAGTSGAHADSIAESGWHHANGAADKCKVCSERTVAAAVIPALMLTVAPVDTALRVSAPVEPAIVSRAGDGLFRPPRA